MNWLVTLIVALLRAFLPAIIQASKPSAEDGSPATELRDRLRHRVRSTWGGVRMWFLMPMALLFMTGCSVRTIYVPNGTPVRLRETIENAKVWVLDKDGVPVASEMDLPEGWYCLPDADSSGGVDQSEKSFSCALGSPAPPYRKVTLAPLVNGEPRRSVSTEAYSLSASGPYIYRMQPPSPNSSPSYSPARASLIADSRECASLWISTRSSSSPYWSFDSFSLTRTACSGDLGLSPFFFPKRLVKNPILPPQKMELTYSRNIRSVCDRVQLSGRRE